MLKFKAISFAIVAVVTVLQTPSTAEAGPLLDWLMGRRCCNRQTLLRPNLCCPQPVVAQSPCVSNCQTTCMQTCQRTVVNYVPYTAYRTSWQAVPVTTYRAQTSVDPCTGCTVSCMRPCTTYTYRACQTPYTTYRPVYSTQAYQVPITYTSQAPVVSGGCNSCGVPSVQQPIQVQPANTVPTITGSLSTGGTYTTSPATGTVVPADTQPQLQQRPVIIEQQPTPAATGSSSRLNDPTQVWPSNSNLKPVADPTPDSNWQNQPPQLFEVEAKTASVKQSPVFERFDYSPVRTASHVEPQLFNRSSQRTTVYTGTIQRSGNRAPQATPSQSNRQPLNQGWRSLNQ